MSQRKILIAFYARISDNTAAYNTTMSSGMHVQARQQNERSDTGMGKGDQRTRKGKIFRGSFGKSRPQKKKVK